RASGDAALCCRAAPSGRTAPSIRTGGGGSYKARANENTGTCGRSTASVRTATSIRTRGGCSYKDRANEEIGICCRSTASVRKPPAPFAPGPGGLRPASAHSKVHADPLPVDLVHADIHLVEIAQHLVTDELLRGSLIHGPAPAHGNDVIGVAGGEVDVVQNHHHGLALLIRRAAQQL